MHVVKCKCDILFLKKVQMCFALEKKKGTNVNWCIFSVQMMFGNGVYIQCTMMYDGWIKIISFLLGRMNLTLNLHNKIVRT